jgi:glyoxylase-like metal-dependent hydrolase (beta-lactamase superfamily II)
MTRRPLPSVRTLAAAAAVATLACASTPSAGPAPAGDALALVDRALAAQGGAAAVAGLRTFTVRGSATYWEPEQSIVPGGDPRLAGEATFTIARDLAAGSARLEWVKKFVYPAPREYRFTEIVTPQAGAVLGVDTTARTKQSQDANPPRHAMSGLRLAAAQRELVRTSPRLLAEMKASPSTLARLPDVAVGPDRLPAVSWTAGNVTFTVLFDPRSGLPARVRTLDADNIRGDSPYDLVLAEWHDVGGVKLPYALRYELGGTEIVRIRIDEASAATPAPAGAFDVPADLLAGAARPATGPVPYQWVLRRQHIGVYLDSDAVHYDPQASGGLKLVELGPGVVHVVGGSHNSLVVELPDAIAVVDAPIDEAQSRWTIDAAKARFPGKPIRFLALTHHHMDHAGGLRSYVAEGATLVVGAGAAAHYRKHLAAPDRLSGGLLASKPRAPEIVEVADRSAVGTGGVLEAIRLENMHAESTLIAWVPQAKLGFVADLWSPGREKLGETLTPGQSAVVVGVRKAGISPERFAGGHGGAADYAPLEALAGKR